MKKFINYIKVKEGNRMKVRPSVKKMCDKCKVIKRKGVELYVKTLNTNKDKGNLKFITQMR